MDQVFLFLADLKSRRILFDLARRPGVGIEVRFATIGARVEVVFSGETSGFAVFRGNEDVFVDDAELAALVDEPDADALARARRIARVGMRPGARQGAHGFPALLALLDRLDARGLPSAVAQRAPDMLEVYFARSGVRIEVNCEAEGLNFSLFFGDEVLVRDEPALKAFIVENHG